MPIIIFICGKVAKRLFLYLLLPFNHQAKDFLLLLVSIRCRTVSTA